jgi:hypothetical protein
MSDRTICYLAIALLVMIICIAMLISETTESPVVPSKVPVQPIGSPP